VGRSNRIAYAFFTYRKDKVLTEVAEKRLQSIKEFTELGSGFKIAMRDLSIRGAGNLLGAQQHGFIDSVGFDLYSQMLKEAVEAKRNDLSPEEKRSVDLDLEIDAYIPDDYIADGHQKIEMYKRFRGISSVEEVDELQDEILDRFGEYPDEVSYLFLISEMKVYATAVGIESMKQLKQDITILFSEQATSNVKLEKVSELIAKNGQMIGLGMEGSKLKLVIHTKGIESRKWFTILFDLVKGLLVAQKEVQPAEK
jgi:transcription-repair coupling factor (superfamily II helicase)